MSEPRKAKFVVEHLLCSMDEPVRIIGVGGHLIEEWLSTSTLYFFDLKQVTGEIHIRCEKCSCTILLKHELDLKEKRECWKLDDAGKESRLKPFENRIVTWLHMTPHTPGATFDTTSN